MDLKKVVSYELTLTHAEGMALADVPGAMEILSRTKTLGLGKSLLTSAQLEDLRVNVIVHLKGQGITYFTLTDNPDNPTPTQRLLIGLVVRWEAGQRR